jgi:hypothetical protein
VIIGMVIVWFRSTAGTSAALAGSTCWAPGPAVPEPAADPEDPAVPEEAADDGEEDPAVALPEAGADELSGPGALVPADALEVATLDVWAWPVAVSPELEEDPAEGAEEQEARSNPAPRARTRARRGTRTCAALTGVHLSDRV